MLSRGRCMDFVVSLFKYHKNRLLHLLWINLWGTWIYFRKSHDIYYSFAAFLVIYVAVEELTLLAEICSFKHWYVEHFSHRENVESWNCGSVVWTREQGCPEIACLESSRHSTVIEIESPDLYGSYFRKKEWLKGGERGMKTKWYQNGLTV